MKIKALIGISIIMILITGIVMFSILLVSANEGHESKIEEGKILAESNISCNELSDEQLEEIGDYYMEQMHPGEAHEYMDRMMGGEGSESLKQVHINMAKSIYCKESSSMMGMMSGMMGSGGMMGNNMMTRGMMGNYYYENPKNNKVYQNRFFVFQIIFYIIATLLIILLILVIILLINKSRDNAKQKRRREYER